MIGESSRPTTADFAEETLMDHVRCQYCWHAVKECHNPGCPQLNPSDRDMLHEWELGRVDGFTEADGPRGDSRLRFSKSYWLGVRVGKEEIDGLVDDAAQSRIFDPHPHED